MKGKRHLASARRNHSFLNILLGMLVIGGIGVTEITRKAIAAPPPSIRVVGNKFQDSQGKTVVLRGVSLTDAEHISKNFGYKFIIDLLTDPSKNWHTKIVRVPIHPHTWLENEAFSQTKADRHFNQYLKPLVDYATSKGLYVIIDWHYVQDPRSKQSQTLAFWKYMAPKFSSYSNVLYEIFNENSSNASSGMTWSTWKNLAQPWINTIRSASAPNIILICGPQYCQHMREAAEAPFYDPMFPNSPNLAYVAHIYPSFYGRQGSSQRQKYEYEIGYLAQRYPVVVTEWGWDEDMSGTEVYGNQNSYGNELKKFIDDYGLSWTSWVASNNPWYPQLFDRNWNPRNGPRYHGSFTRDWLSEKRNSNPSQAKPSTLSFPLRIAAGSNTEFIASDGSKWVPDQGFLNGLTVERGDVPIANTSNARIYQTERYGLTGYTFAIPNGNYLVKLHFAETYNGISAKGQRVFDVAVEEAKLANVDVYSEANGRNIALVKTINVTVKDGQLDIKFTPRVQLPMINALEVIPTK
ncbi:glycoside hydrolase family 5 [Gloeocapsa sp. PCC 7428]|uniref:cellulase family glycosylhydrolase n=1 Tax=Gloeocapsa sp. PCC 7428 TaxID=1173026 RepID=UPI0002A5E953|nr:cellulase family glycosylhydrolase [Gloeocapsa sp. PCC 7428]AFZ30668.1 glycoside hydrolase family 5 [Gloeocapsa sp. PCC 7428]